jgi:hypothetical protein
MLGGCLEDAWRMLGGCLGGCLEDPWRILGGMRVVWALRTGLGPPVVWFRWAASHRDCAFESGTGECRKADDGIIAHRLDGLS